MKKELFLFLIPIFCLLMPISAQTKLSVQANRNSGPTIFPPAIPKITGISCNNWLYLPSAPSYVDIGQLNIPGDQLTVEANINLTTPITGGSTAPLGPSGPSIASDIAGKYKDPSDVNYLLRVQNAQITTTNGFYKTPDICDNIAGKTYHVAMVYDGSSLKYYRNGFLMAQIPASGNLIQNSWSAQIGYYYSEIFNTNFIGYINEVRIWNVARTQSQIQAYMNTSLPSPATQTGLLAYYTFDNLLNKQGNPAWNGTVNGGASINNTNPTCAAFVPDNDCCPIFQGTLTGGTICSGSTTQGLLTYHANNGTGPFTLTYSDGINSYTQTNVQSDVPFAVQTTPVSTTTYTISAIQDNSTGCTTNGVSGVTGTLTVNTSSGTDFAFDQNICNPLNVTFSGISQTGTSYSWTINGINYAGNSSQNQSFTDTGTYPVKLKTTSPNGCVDSTSKNISINFRNGNSISTNDTVICSGHNVQLSAKPALQYCWTPGATLDNPALANPTASPTVTTTYYLTSKITGTNLVINGNFESGNTGFSSACVYDPVNVTEGEYFVGTSPHNWNANAPVDCGDHTSGSGNMMIVNGAQTPDVNVWATSQISVQPNTNYAFSAWTQSISPYNPATLQFSINGLKSGNSINANANTCIWNQFYTIWNSGSNTTATISLVNENTFFLGNDFALDDISFAPVTLLQDSVIVTVEAPAVTAFPDTSVCPGSPVRLTAAGSLAAGAFTYSWTPSAGLSDSTRFDPIALPSVTTNYIVTATTTHGCTATTSVLLNVFPGVNIGLTPDTTICPGASLQLQASGGFGYSWTPSQFLDNSLSSTPQVAPADTTRFFVTVTDRNNCSAKDSVLVRVRPPVLFNAPSNEEICKGYSVILKSVNSEAYVYNWSPADGLSNPSAPFPTAGPAATVVYTVNMSDPVCGHDSIFNVSVTVKPGPNVKAQKANDIDCAITTAQLSATGAVDYLWTPEEGLNNSRIPNPIANIDSTTTYIVQGTDENGCSAFDTLTVKVTAAGHNLFVVPNAFTPNGDGRNDCFGIRRWGDVRVEEFSVYNRWGGRVFTTRNPSDCWDGYFNGKPQEAGTYVYIIRAWSFCGEITRKGTVMLIR